MISNFVYQNFNGHCHASVSLFSSSLVENEICYFKGEDIPLKFNKRKSKKEKNCQVRPF